MKTFLEAGLVGDIILLYTKPYAFSYKTKEVPGLRIF